MCVRMEMMEMIHHGCMTHAPVSMVSLPVKQEAMLTERGEGHNLRPNRMGLMTMKKIAN
jgi:hypothetical protein